MQDYLSNNSLEMKCAENRHFILQIALKCADISNPCRPWDISRKWSYKVCEEFFRQGDYERRLNLPVTPLCDRHTTSIPKIQAGFFKHVVTPLYVEWHRFLGDGLSVSLMEYLKMNQKKWETMINQEATEERKTEISELDEPEGVTSSGEETAVDEELGSIELLIPPTYVQTARMPTLPGQVGLDRVGRRHSVPLSVSKSLQLPLSQNIRRDSLPSERVKTKDSLWKIENQSLFELSSLSLLSSKSNMTESPNASVAERPISAENLLPETSIASITSSTEMSRLNTVLQSDNQNSVQTKQLTRQQTFPPLQSHVRARYMSATVEMSQCYTQVLTEADNSFSCSKDKSCSSGRYCSPSRDSNSRHQKKSNMSSVPSKELLMGDTPIKKQGSNLLDTAKQKYLNSERRHSIQTIRSDDSFSKHRYKRPSSAQEPDYTELFYATLTGSHSDKNKCVPDMCISECKSNLDCNIEFKCHGAKLTVQELQTTSKKLDQHLSLAKSAHSAQEPRRHSTSTTECGTITVDHTGRRYTTIPVSSELSTHKVFFIGSPPDSPPPNHSVSSSSDSGSEPKRSIDDSNKETVVLIGNRKELIHVKEKNSKITKFNSDVQMKENVDPCTNDDFAKASRKGNQVRKFIIYF